MKTTIQQPRKDHEKVILATLSVSSDNKSVYMTPHEARCLAYEILAVAATVDNINLEFKKQQLTKE